MRHVKFEKWVPLLLGAQFVLVSLLAPGDGGRWAKYTLLFLAVFDFAAFLVMYLVTRLRKDNSPGIPILGLVMIAVGSFFVAVAGTYAMDYYKLS